MRTQYFKGVPSTETVWLQVLKQDTDIVLYVVTSDKLRQWYKLYSVADNKATYTKHKAQDPRELDKYIKY